MEDDSEKNPFEFLKAAHLSQMGISVEEEKRKPMKVFQRKMKRKASSIDVTVVNGGNMKMNTSSNDFSTCPVCFKFFHNKKALFGHMRAHPERQWRGIQPPSSPLMEKKKNFSSSSSTVSDSLVMNVDCQIDSAASTSGRLGLDDVLLGSVSNWPGTVKKRRNVAVSDHRVLDAIDGLLMLVHGNPMEETDHAMFIDSKNEAMNKSEDEAKWKKVKVYHSNGGDLRSVFVPELMKMECVDVDDDYNKLKPVINNISNGFKCGICNKSFPSYQALGGHKSSRSCRNTTCQPGYQNQYKKISCPNMIKVDQDLKEFNDTRQEDVDSKHKCKVCGKTYPTGQALGGHQRSHWNGAAPSVSSMTLPQMHNVETPSGSVASVEDHGKTNIKLLEFDLNELPQVDYDEECFSQLVPPVFGLAL